MRISPITAALCAASALSGWMLRGVQTHTRARGAPAPPALQSPMATYNEPLPFGVIHPGTSQTVNSRRNLFLYAERSSTPRPSVASEHRARTPAPDTSPVPLIVADTRPVRLPFPYRYFGTFGPANRPFAAFALNGEIVIARPGNRVGEHFVLQSIGLESVELAADTGGAIQIERVPLGGPAATRFDH